LIKGYLLTYLKIALTEVIIAYKHIRTHLYNTIRPRNSMLL